MTVGRCCLTIGKGRAANVAERNASAIKSVIVVFMIRSIWTLRVALNPDDENDILVAASAATGITATTKTVAAGTMILTINAVETRNVAGRIPNFMIMIDTAATTVTMTHLFLRTATTKRITVNRVEAQREKLVVVTRVPVLHTATVESTRVVMVVLTAMQSMREDGVIWIPRAITPTTPTLAVTTGGAGWTVLRH